MDKSEPRRRPLTRDGLVPHQQAMANAPKKLHIKTFGCQMNAYDSERMAEALGAHGYEPTTDMEGADLVILNTCHIREKAAEKVYSELGRIRAVKQAREARGLDTMIAVAGCVAQAEGSEILERAQVVDLVVGPQSYHELPALLGRVRNGGERVVATEFPAEDKFLSSARAADRPRPAFRLPHRAGRLRQILHVLRRALYARRRILAPSRPSSPRPRGLRGPACANSRCSGRM